MAGDANRLNTLVSNIGLVVGLCFDRMNYKQSYANTMPPAVMTPANSLGGL